MTHVTYYISKMYMIILKRVFWRLELDSGIVIFNIITNGFVRVYNSRQLYNFKPRNPYFQVTLNQPFITILFSHLNRINSLWLPPILQVVCLSRQKDESWIILSNWFWKVAYTSYHVLDKPLYIKILLPWPEFE